MKLLDEVREFLKSIAQGVYLPSDKIFVTNVILYKAIDIFQYDWLRWYPDSKIDIERLYLTPQLIPILCYRIARELYKIGHAAENQTIADAFSILGRQIGLIEIYYSADIGEGFKINHGVGSVIGARCRIGRNFTIHQGCTIGDRRGGRPNIGDNVIMYANSLILGDINIGNNSIIGANSVVTNSCPDKSVLVGSPAKKINNRLNHPK